MEHLPHWLGRDLLGSALPWRAGIAVSLAGLLERYTLRGADYIGLWYETGRSATLLVRWDAGEREDADPAATLPAARPILAVRFESLERSEVRLRTPELAGAVSGPANRAEDWHRTRLTDRDGGQAILVHSPAVRVLSLSPGGEPLPLLVSAETV